MRSLIIIEVEHGDTTDGVQEALFDFGIGSQFDPQADDQWPTAFDGATWPNLAGIDYTVLDYTVRVDVPARFYMNPLDSMIPSFDTPVVDSHHTNH